jgi:hypothetical protein
VLDPVDARRRVVQALRLHYLTLLSNPLWISFNSTGHSSYLIHTAVDQRSSSSNKLSRFFGRIILRVEPAVLAVVVLHKETERLNKTGGCNTLAALWVGEFAGLAAVSRARGTVVLSGSSSCVLEPRGRELTFEHCCYFASRARFMHATVLSKPMDEWVRGGGVQNGIKGHELRDTPCANFAMSWFSLRHAGRFVKDALVLCADEE